jgi:ABC-type bacteriocin/lantibiotic exporter with double-glycine peptidase domain
MVNVILGHLESKTRILVTHAIDFLPLADKIVLMEYGRIVACGSFQELRNHEKIKALISINKLNQDNT